MNLKTDNQEVHRHRMDDLIHDHWRRKSPAIARSLVRLISGIEETTGRIRERTSGLSAVETRSIGFSLTSLPFLAESQSGIERVRVEGR